MAINNVYNQTPKRIFTNKPFVKGMSYTNADMSPYVCRAVSNLELESSNTGTHVRQGIHNKILTTDCEILKFYDKYVVIPNTITEVSYRNNTIYDDASNIKCGIKLVSDDFNTEYGIFQSVIYNDTDISYDTELHINGVPLTNISDNIAFFILKLNDGTVNYAINSNDRSISFFGSIAAINNNPQCVYTGLITIYFHVAANKAIIEVIRPTIVSPQDVIDYGTNIIADNPLVYKDYVFINSNNEEYDMYLNYTGGVSEKLIDITTVQVYDTPVDPVGNDTNSTANLVNGFDKETQGDIYVRPYLVLPKGNYSATLAASSPGDTNNEYYYNFQTNSFTVDPTYEKSMDIEIMNGSIDVHTDNRAEYLQDLNNYYISGETQTSDLNIIFQSKSTPYNMFSMLPRHPEAPYILNDMFDKCMSIPIKTNSYGASNVYELLNKVNGGTNSWSNIFSNNVAVSSSLLYYKDYTPEHIENTGTVLPISQVKLSATNKIADINLTDASHIIDIPVSMYVKTDIYRTDPINKLTYGGSDIAVGLKLNADNMYGSNGAPLESFTETFTINQVFGSDSIKWLDGTSISVNGESDKTYTTNMSNLGVSASCTLAYTNYRQKNGRDIYTVKVTCDVSIDWDIANKLDLSKNYILKCIRISPATYPFLSTEYYVDTTLSNALSFSIKHDVTRVLVSPKINVDEINKYLPWGKIGALCTKIHPDTTYEKDVNNGGIIDFVNSSYPLGYHASSHNVTDDSTMSPISIVFPQFSVYEKRRKTVISDSFIKHIQTLNSDSPMDTAYNLQVARSSVNDISKFSNGGALVFKVSVFPTTDDNVIDSPEAVSAISAIIKTYEDDLIKYDTLKNETKFKYGVDHMAMHLGHYVFWGKETTSNILYYSEFNNPAYIPSSYAIEFSDPIVHVHPHLGNLIVFTTDDIYMLHNGTVPSTTSTDGSEVPFTKSIIQSNTRLGYDNINTVKSIGKDIFFITSNGDGYLLKTNRYVSDSSDTYLIKITNQIEDLIKNPYQYCLDRANNSNYKLELSDKVAFKYLEPNSISNLPVNDNFQIISVDQNNNITIQDGDTFYYNNKTFRLADIDATELSTNDKLSETAKIVLTSHLADSNANIKIYYRTDLTDYYGRYIAWVFKTIDDKHTYINAEMVRCGLAKLYMENIYSEELIIDNDITVANYIRACANEAIRNNRGINNNLNYNNTIEYANDVLEYDSNMYKLHTYATNSYIYIIQSVGFKDNKGYTIIYKYNIDSRIWTTYDFVGAVFPTEVIPDSTKTGFAMICTNKGKSFSNQIFSYLTFSNHIIDYNEVANYSGNIHIYFDTGNQTLAIMNEKLFREFKLSLGNADSKSLDINYKIKVFIDGKEISGRDKYLKGKQEDENGFKKITLLTPCRGRIPRYTIDIECESDINILEYAIVYLQLNAK